MATAVTHVTRESLIQFGRRMWHQKHRTVGHCYFIFEVVALAVAIRNEMIIENDTF